MRLTTRIVPNSEIDAPWIALPIFEGGALPAASPASAMIETLVASKDIAGKAGEVTTLYGSGPNSGHILVFGLGDRDKLAAGSAFSAGVAVAKRLSGKPRERVAVVVKGLGGSAVRALVEGVFVGTVGPGLRKSEPARHPFGELILVAESGGPLDDAGLARAAEQGKIVGEAVNLARELVNTPPSEKTPSVLAERAEAVARDIGIEAETWDAARLRAERFGGVLAVASGSDQEPRFVHLRYRKGGDTRPIALVGKGVTFDSGGLSLKPSASMEDMKCDMTGAAVVLATIQAIARLGLAVNVDAYFPLTENMTGGSAMKLGDVLTMRNGLTVEVLNTDAEGRLILADALSFAVENRPTGIIDLATLTGACMVALGTKVAGLFANDDALADRVLAASRLSGERAWRLPMDDDYGDLIKSKVAEIKNVGGKYGGAITAAKFLQRFVGETPWVHLDIAGPAWADDDSATRDAGGTGCFVRTLIALLETQAKEG